MNTSPQHRAVGKSPTQRVDEELVRRGWKVGDLAKRLGVKSAVLSNYLCGNNPGKALWIRMEDVLGLPLVSSPELFTARQMSITTRSSYKAQLFSRACGALAAMDNWGQEFQTVCETLGISIIVCQFDGSPKSPFWDATDTGAPFDAELREISVGQVDSVQMLEGTYFVFFHCTDLARALHVIKSCVQARGLLDHTRIFHIEANSGWRVYWPQSEAGELIATKE